MGKQGKTTSHSLTRTCA